LPLPDLPLPDRRPDPVRAAEEARGDRVPREAGLPREAAGRITFAGSSLL
jgi:hypothetical protein